MTFVGSLWLVGAVGAVVVIQGCGSSAVDGPPEIRYGDSICIECGMIISDERFATSTIIVGDRGDEPLLFDDFNCQMIFESKQTDLTIVDRWSHDHGSLEWLHTSEAWFVRSDQLSTPMASHLALFESQASAKEFAESLGGEVIDFQTVWMLE